MDAGVARSVIKTIPHQVGDRASVVVDGKLYTGRIYHVRENGWACVECPNGHVASGPDWHGEDIPRGDR